MLNHQPEHSSEHADADRHLWIATLQATLLAASAMILSGWLVWLTLPAKWVARGYPSYIGYGKNVEHAGLIVGALAAMAIASICLWRPLGWRWTAPLALCGPGIALYYGRPEMAWVLPLVFAGVAGLFVWFQRLHHPAALLTGDQPAEIAEPWPRWCSMAALVAMAGICFARAVWPIPLDGFHQGEVVLTALDWLQGGKPFETIFWPHGMHDTWLTAQMMEATGNRGIGAVVLSRAITQVVGLMTLQVTALCLLRRWADAVWMTALIALMMPGQIFQLGVVGMGILPLAILARGHTPAFCLLVGVLLSWGFLWRFDSGLFGLAAALGYVGLIEFYAAYAAGSSLGAVLLDRHRWLAAGTRGAAIVSGVAAGFVISRMAIGLPTWQLLRMTLLELPRYHADNTGFPLSLPIERFDAYLYQEFIWARWFTPAYLLVALMLAATLVRLMAQRRYRLAELGDRYFLAFGLFVLLQTKTMLDRAGPHRLGFSVLLLGFLLVFYVLARLHARQPSAWIRLGWGGAMALLMFGLVLPQAGSLGQSGLSDSIAGAQATFQAVRYPRRTLAHLRTLLRPTTDWPDLLEPTVYEHKVDLHEGVREARTILASQHVGDRQLAIVHSGPIFYPALGLQPATRYYMLGWAMNDAMEHQAVEELRTNGLRGLLRINGLGSVLPMYDMPDEFRVPIIDDYLKQESAGWPLFYTRLGGLHIDPAAGAEYWSVERSGDAPCVIEGNKRYPIVPDSVQGWIDVVAADEDDGLAIAGWSASPADGTPTRRLLLMKGDQVVLAFTPYCERQDVVKVFSQPGFRFCGFHLRLPRRLFDACPPGEIRLLAISTTTAAEIPLHGQSATLASQPAEPATVK